MSVRVTRAIFHNPRFEEALYHLKKTFTRYPFRHEFEQYLVMNTVKSRFDISLHGVTTPSKAPPVAYLPDLS